MVNLRHVMDDQAKPSSDLQGNINYAKQVFLEGIKNISDIMEALLDTINDDTLNLGIKNQHGYFLDLFNYMTHSNQNHM